jgi:hypothetical protein
MENGCEAFPTCYFWIADLKGGQSRNVKHSSAAGPRHGVGSTPFARLADQVPAAPERLVPVDPKDAVAFALRFENRKRVQC